eukprot:SAG22_NODE_852_length_6847_cov_14.600830_5_plen_48_part_00
MPAKYSYNQQKKDARRTFGENLKIVIWANIRSLIKKIIFYIEALDLR